MGILSTPTYEPNLLPASPTAALIFSSTPTPSPPPGPQPTDSSSGSIQLSTIFGIVVGIVGFVILILATAYISKLPCFRRSQYVPPTSSRPSVGQGYPYTPYQVLYGRPQDSIQHVELTITAPSVLALAVHRSQRLDRQPSYLPAYGGSSPPAYSEFEAVQPRSAVPTRS